MALKANCSATRKVIMPITAGTETFQEIGEELRRDGTMVTDSTTSRRSSKMIDYYISFPGLSYVCTLTSSESLSVYHDLAEDVHTRKTEQRMSSCH